MVSVSRTNVCSLRVHLSERDSKGGQVPIISGAGAGLTLPLLTLHEAAAAPRRQIRRSVWGSDTLTCWTHLKSEIVSMCHHNYTNSQAKKICHFSKLRFIVA